jgi:hypothetical protein
VLPRIEEYGQYRTYICVCRTLTERKTCAEPPEENKGGKKKEKKEKKNVDDDE